MPTSFMLQLKNVREVVREGNDEPTGVVVTQVIMIVSTSLLVLLVSGILCCP